MLEYNWLNLVNINTPHDTYIVVIRAGSRLRFLTNELLRVNANINNDEVSLTFQTRYSDEGFESAIPRELWIDARGKAKSLDMAIISFTNAADFFIRVISFCTNGYAGECNYHIAYNSTPGKNNREFFEHFVENERGLPHPSRKISPKIVQEFIEQLGKHEEKERLRRAIVQYDLALKYWANGEQILAVSHLYMGMEALVKVAIRSEQSKHKLDTPDQLASFIGIQIKELDSTIRKNILFHGDVECHRAAKKTSDGVEHGFLEFNELRPLAIQSRDKLAKYLRKAIIDLLDLPTDLVTELLEKPYIDPVGTERYVRYLRGNIISEHDDLSAEGQEYPIIDWKFNVKSFSIGKEGDLNISFGQKITPSLGKGVSFKLEKIEVYGPEGIMVKKKGEFTVEPEVVQKDVLEPKKSQDGIKEHLLGVIENDKIVDITIRTNDGEKIVISRGEAESKK